MHRFRKTKIALVLAALAGASASASAASMCATSGVDLQNKLLIAATNNEFDEVRVVAGGLTTQSAPNGLRWSYASAQNFGLVLSGGWLGPDCIEPHPQGTRTTLAGQGTARVLEVIIQGGAGNVVVRDLTIQGGGAGAANLASGFRIGTSQLWTGSMTVERIRISGSLDTAVDAAAFRVDASGGTVTVRNSLFSQNVSGSAIRAAALSGADLRLVNNTVVDFMSLADEAALVFAYNAGNLQLSNNVFARNVGAAGLGFREVFSTTGTMGTVELRNNHFERGAGGMIAFNQATTTGDARLSLAGLPVPEAQSPVRNTGFGQAAGGIALTDLALQDRVQGVAVDKGALEFPEIFSHGFED